MRQDYSLYTETDHATWRTLYARMLPQWRSHANPRFLEGIDQLCLDPEHVPRLSDVNRFLEPLTGFAARAVPGYVPAFEFFDALRTRVFPTTVTVRPPDKLDYLPEPDIFHDIAGHVPMHTDKAFADTLVRFGDCAHSAAGRARDIQDPAARTHIMANVIRALARFFWFTVEFGLMRTRDGMKAYGSGLLSSHGELAHAILSPKVQRYPLQLEWVVNQGFEIDHYQPLLFWVEGFDRLFEEVGRLDQWMREGKLDHVAPGEPTVNERDLASFLSFESLRNAGASSSSTIAAA
ncbi:MAG TPA: phenylalanine 4-monooxygenase [Bryobacteraceae bacterium]|jgi:phenylalanine-4-hydroxylase|nr:phenylalanine 4-monooxygenase [Bryobacteraceae bacterium]